MKRVVEPEWLDELPANDPGAIGSRRDIHRLNKLMGNSGTLVHLLKTSANGHRPKRIVELGAGEGTFMLQLARELSRNWPAMEVILVDCKDVVTKETRAEFAALGWPVEVVTADVFDWLRGSMANPVDVIIANLFLHQFADAPLTEMLRLAAERTRVFAACEPLRSQTALLVSRMLGLIGCNAVTRHDAVASVRAGFTNEELSALWPDRAAWQLREHKVRNFTHAFVASRNNAH